MSIPTTVAFRTISTPNLLWMPVWTGLMWLNARSHPAEVATMLRMCIVILVRWLWTVSSPVPIPSQISTGFTCLMEKYGSVCFTENGIQFSTSIRHDDLYKLTVMEIVPHVAKQKTIEEGERRLSYN
jgi:hypothetical protein